MKTLLTREFEVAAPPEQAWSHLARIEEWPTWARHIRSIEVDPTGALSLETTGVIRLTNGVRSTFRMTRLDPGRSWVWEGGFLWMNVRYDHVFEPTEGGGTRIRFVVEGEGFGQNTLGRLFAAIYARNLDRAIPNLIEELRGS